jgi:hypothetical protein
VKFTMEYPPYFSCRVTLFICHPFAICTSSRFARLIILGITIWCCYIDTRYVRYTILYAYSQQNCSSWGLKKKLKNEAHNSGSVLMFLWEAAVSHTELKT